MRIAAGSVIAILCLCLSCFQSKAQNVKLYASPRGNADVLDANGDTLLNPWCGGWLNPEFSSIDLNGDGLLDLFVFMPGLEDNRVLTFLNIGNGHYQYAPNYESFFPPMQYWAILVDYNKDGKPDIFTFAQSGAGMDVYENVSDENGLKFKRITPRGGQLDYTDNSGDRSNIFSSQFTVPAITDVDGDGDIDIVSFDVLFHTAKYFKNNAVEKGESLDSLDFTNPTCSWGGFQTYGGLTVDSTLKISSTPSWGISSACFGASMSQKDHGASTMLLVDMDNDGDLDMLYGNLYNKFIIQMTNGRIESGAIKNVHDTIVTVDSAIFGDNHKINVDMFPAAYLADGTGDNVPDIITAPFFDTCNAMYHKTYLYQNTGIAPGNHFKFVTDNFLQNTMLDVGEHAAPAFLDYNHDGLMDLVIATRDNLDSGYLFNPRAYDHLELYENIGTKEKAVFKKVDDDFGSLKKHRLTFLAPTFADLDGDGRPDMFLGTASGKVMYFKNMGDSDNTLIMKLISDSMPGISDISNSAPCLAHISSDTLFDLLMGRDTGTFSYFKNIGNKISPKFKKITDFFGKVRTNAYDWQYTKYDTLGNPIDSALVMEPIGSSTPVIADLDHNGKPDLISGSYSGRIFVWFNITDSLNGTFTRTDTVFYNTLKHAKENKNLGSYTMPAAADLDGDGYPELLVGNYCGGIQYFGSKKVNLTNLYSGSPMATPCFNSMFSLYPNPAKDKVTLQYDNSLMPEEAEINVTNLMGKTVAAIPFLMASGRGNAQIPITAFAPGIYFVSVTTNSHYYSGGKLVIAK